MPSGLLPGVVVGNSPVTAPAVVIRPILLGEVSVNHRFPSGPPAIEVGPLPEVVGNSVIMPAVVIRPILSAPSVNHKFPSGPAAMPPTPALAVGTGNSVTTPAVVIRPMLFPWLSVNHRLPSGPATISCGFRSAVGIGNSLIATDARPGVESNDARTEIETMGR
jgi:hypothetical protein